MSESGVTASGEAPPNVRATAAEITDEIVDGVIVVLGQYDTDTLLAVAAERDKIRKDGWLQRVIREYVDVWR